MIPDCKKIEKLVNDYYRLKKSAQIFVAVKN